MTGGGWTPVVLGGGAILGAVTAELLGAQGAVGAAPFLILLVVDRVGATRRRRWPPQ